MITAHVALFISILFFNFKQKQEKSFVTSTATPALLVCTSA
jgi:hypothetical protein